MPSVRRPSQPCPRSSLRREACELENHKRGSERPYPWSTRVNRLSGRAHQIARHRANDLQRSIRTPAFCPHLGYRVASTRRAPAASRSRPDRSRTAASPATCTARRSRCTACAGEQPARVRVHPGSLKHLLLHPVAMPERAQSVRDAAARPAVFGLILAMRQTSQRQRHSGRPRTEDQRGQIASARPCSCRRPAPPSSSRLWRTLASAGPRTGLVPYFQSFRLARSQALSGP